MLTNVEVKGYQSLKNVNIELGKFTVITGPSNSGKSALLRALSAVVFNQSGDAFVHKDMTNCKVTMTFDDGNVVVWGRGKTNAYEVNGQTFTKLNRSVPEEVSDALGIKAIEVDGLKIVPQMADQFDGPFLIEESGMKAARVIAKMTRLDVILTALTRCIKDIKANQTLLVTTLTQLKEKEEQTNSFEELEGRLKALEQAEADVQEYEELAAEMTKLQNLLEKNVQLKSKLDIPEIPIKEIDELLQKFELLEDVEGIAHKNFELNIRLAQVEHDIQTWQLAIKQYEKELEGMDNICPECGQVING